MQAIVIYIHGKSGEAKEAEQYKQLFPDSQVIGFDYHSQKPWQAKKEFLELFENINNGFADITLIANSIGAYFALHSLGECNIKKAYFISPIVNMEKLIMDMMAWADVSEEVLRQKGTIPTSFGEELSWEYLCWVRSNPITWGIPTSILYGSKDSLQSFATINEFATAYGCDLTVMQGGEHWFHTAEQMAFLFEWMAK